MKRNIIALLAAFVTLSWTALAGGPVSPPGPVPITCGGGNSFTAYPGYGQAPTCGTALNTGTINAGAAPQIAQYTAANTLSASTISGDGTLAAGGALTITKTSGVAFSALATTTPGTGVATFLATPSAANFASMLTGAPLTVAVLGGSAASHAVPVDVAGTSTWKVIPDCTDTGGNHLNFTQSTDAFSCGTSGGVGGSVSVTAATPNIVVTPSPLTGTGTIGTTIPQNTPTDGGSHSYAPVAGDLTKQVILVSTFTAAAVPQATGSFAAGASFTLTNKGAITATSTTSTVNGIAGATGIKLGANTTSNWVSDGTNWIVAVGEAQCPTQTGSTFHRDDGACAAPAGAGTVTNASNLTDKAVVVGSGGTTGVATLASLGNSGDVLTSAGAGVLPSFQAPSGASLSCDTGFTASYGRCKWTQSPAASANNCGAINCFAWTGLSKDRYTLQCSNVFGNTTSEIVVQFHLVGAGASTWQTTGYFRTQLQITGTTTVQGFSATSGIGLYLWFQTSSGGTNGAAKVDFFDLTSGSIMKVMDFDSMDYRGSNQLQHSFGNTYLSTPTTAVDGIRILDTQGTPVSLTGTNGCTLAQVGT